MSDNVIKFRRPEKPNEKSKDQPAKTPGGAMPSWLPFALLFALALIIFFAQGSGILS
ncbi:hypothetical protein [Devosia faecipullorum]|uniref:hypothetical protein n=1 Tax=Devosia faecipullorum TaxID=2755039 RepID=UPI00187B38F1|nr:hypothetical protein [Devosia faecipullorum]MBE7733081.1 hypothetical protein [Devosia faecipullorum]